MKSLTLITYSGVEKLGLFVSNIISGLGSISIFAARFFKRVLKPPYRINSFMKQMYFVGNQSLFIVAIAGAFTGMVLAYQTYFSFRLLSVDSVIGPVTALSLSRELAPVLTGLIVSGRVGAAMAAEIGTMRVTEQIDAIEVMGIDSIQYLAIPRILAAIIAMPMLSGIFLYIGNTGAYFIGTQVLMIDEVMFYSKIGDYMFIEDIYQGLIKAAIFGFAISVIGTFFGFNAEDGAEGVGKGTNLAVVWGMISVLILDYFATSLLVHIL